MRTDADSIARSVLLPAGAGVARLIVCERSGRWAVAMRRELVADGIRVHETRSLAECWEVLAAAPGSFVVVELTPANAETLLGRMAWLHSEFPLARITVVADRGLAAYEWLMREAGAVYFTCSPRRLGPAARLVRRHLDQVPSPPQSVVERIWASLPWGNDEARIL